MTGSIFMPEMTNLQVREYLEGDGHTVIVPVGSTEDHGDHGPLWTWFRYGESASRSIAVYFLPWVIDPHQDHRWMMDRLDLAKYPIIHRQLPASEFANISGSNWLDPATPTRSMSEASPTPEPAVQAQAS